MDELPGIPLGRRNVQKKSQKNTRISIECIFLSKKPAQIAASALKFPMEMPYVGRTTAETPASASRSKRGGQGAPRVSAITRPA
jgi:hypothetical protein